jgi:hypothetical protein
MALDIKTVSGSLKAGRINITNCHVFNIRVVHINGDKFCPKAKPDNRDTQLIHENSINL